MGIVGNFQTWHNRWKFIDLQALTLDIASKNEPRIAVYNRKQLFEEGEDSLGRKLRKYARAKYARVKHEMNPLPGLGNPDLFVTGAFHKSIFVDVKSRSLVFDSNDAKADLLVHDLGYGNKIFGLQEESITLVWVEVLRPPLLPIINKLTGSNLI